MKRGKSNFLDQKRWFCRWILFQRLILEQKQIRILLWSVKIEMETEHQCLLSGIRIMFLCVNICSLESELCFFGSISALWNQCLLSGINICSLASKWCFFGSISALWHQNYVSLDQYLHLDIKTFKKSRVSIVGRINSHLENWWIVMRWTEDKESSPDSDIEFLGKCCWFDNFFAKRIRILVREHLVLFLCPRFFLFQIPPKNCAIIKKKSKILSKNWSKSNKNQQRRNLQVSEFRICAFCNW